MKSLASEMGLIELGVVIGKSKTRQVAKTLLKH